MATPRLSSIRAGRAQKGQNRERGTGGLRAPGVLTRDVGRNGNGVVGDQQKGRLTVYYTIETVDGGWSVRFAGQTLATFATHAEASAYIKGRRSCA